ncbi:hypothetical protein [Bradyrhizobium sp. BWA-3-5]|uniref:hypothetical protein n=1 Tax=Bradyrhizobium sp. BWA-3-5 TaxID=3080013 RepID=UPI00293E749F|nr:hypothetical protein [Bradyrhizobium sp. BWA-3-5]WOH66164.1 hypothetical protein RX331_37580 [Bradyrhizobium sp. BWA-3-5]
MGKPTKEDKERFLAEMNSERIDNIAEYASTGRVHRELSNDQLIDAFVEAMKAQAATPNAVVAELQPLQYEMELRKIEPPYDRIATAVSKISRNAIDRLRKAYDKLR